MAQMRSIRFHLSLMLLFFFLLIACLGSMTLATLRYVDTVSTEIRDQWLQTTRLLNDFNNHTSDFRAAEGTMLLASDEAAFEVSAQEIAKLDRLLAQTQHGYEAIPHPAKDSKLYAKFLEQWADYRTNVDREASLMRSGDKEEATSQYHTVSRTAYDASSDTIDLLISRNVSGASEASERAGSAYREKRGLIITIIIICGFSVAVAASFIRRWVSEPLLCLSAQLRGLAVDQATEIVGTARRDEIGAIAQAATALRDSTAGITESRRVLADKASELEKELDQEKRLTDLQRDFVSMTAYDLRTPLTIIDGQAQRLIRRSDQAAAHEITERAEKMRNAIRRITGSLDGLLDTSRLIDGFSGLQLRRSEFNLVEMIDEACRLHYEAVPGCLIIKEFPQETIWLIGDRALLLQAFNNLISTAAKLMSDGTPIVVAVRSHSGRVAVIVRGCGNGVSESGIENALQSGYCIDGASGILWPGVGLYFTKMVAELHGGDVAVTSSPFWGAQLVVSLPLRPADGDVETIAPEAVTAEPATAVCSSRFPS